MFFVAASCDRPENVKAALLKDPPVVSVREADRMYTCHWLHTN